MLIKDKALIPSGTARLQSTPPVVISRAVRVSAPTSIMGRKVDLARRPVRTLRDVDASADSYEWWIRRLAKKAGSRAWTLIE